AAGRSNPVRRVLRRPPLPPRLSTRRETRSTARRTAAAPVRADGNSTRLPPIMSDDALSHPAAGLPGNRNDAPTETASEKASASALAPPPTPAPAEDPPNGR